MLKIRNLAALAISAGVLLLGSAAAQVTGNNPLTCSTNVGVTPTIRAESYTERVGEIILMCTGGTPTDLGKRYPL